MSVLPRLSCEFNKIEKINYANTFGALAVAKLITQSSTPVKKRV
jgi:hypothetical protein